MSLSLRRTPFMSPPRRPAPRTPSTFNKDSREPVDPASGGLRSTRIDRQVLSQHAAAANPQNPGPLDPTDPAPHQPSISRMSLAEMPAVPDTPNEPPTPNLQLPPGVPPQAGELFF